MHLGLEAGHGDVVAVGPQADAVVLEHGLARCKHLAQQRVGEALALVDGQGGTRQLGVLPGAVAALGGVHALATVEYPVRQRCAAHRLAGHDVVGDPLRDLLPAGGLPGLERAHRPAVAPADRQVHVARGLGDVGQVVGAVVEQVAKGRPQELGLRVLAFAQLLEFLGGVADLQDLDHLRRSGAVGRTVVLFLDIDDEDVLADLAEDAGAGLLAERTLADQRLQPRGRLEVGVPRIVRQGVAHGLDDVGHGVQADHVRGPVGRRLGAADQRAADRIDLVEAELERAGVVDRGQDREHPDPVADEVRGVLGVDHALAEGAGEEGLQPLQHIRVGGLGRDQFGQVHVARRVEEVHAAEPMPKFFWKNFRQLVDSQA